MRKIAAVFLVLAVSFTGACATKNEAPPRGFEASIREEGGLSIQYNSRLLYILQGISGQTFNAEVSMLFGFWDFVQHDLVETPLDIRETDTGFGLFDGDSPVGTLIQDTTDAGNGRISIKIFDGTAFDGIKLNFAAENDEKFWGFGEQYNHVDFRGQQVSVWVQEQGVGRAEDPPFPFMGTLTDSYFPMPHVYDPVAGKGLLITNTEYSEFDICAANSDQWSATVWNGSTLSMIIFTGENPADLVKQLTDETGRPPLPPPDWAFEGVWLAAQGGTQAVRDRVAVAMDAGIPLSAVWVQDWLGLRNFSGDQFGVQYHWLPDEEWYPGLENLIDDLAGQGVRFLGYFNPFVLPNLEHWDEGEQQGYLVTDAEGEVYDFTIITFKGTVLDVTNPDAIEWYKGFARAATAMGMKGWMADFGEWLPFDGVVHSGTAAAEHNRYPTRWHQANREVLQEAYPNGDFVLLTRSGYTGEQPVAQVVWAGDQEADWSAEDGLPTVVTAGLTLGMAGIPFFTHDIAGFSGGPSDKELFMRWVELGAFTPVMRTHDGLKKLENHRFDSDAETLAHFSYFARVHATLLPVWKSLAQEAVASGLPMIRHTLMVDPDWTEARNAHGQWMLGNDILIAPVVTQGSHSVEVHLPQGDWEQLFTGDTFEGRSVHTVDATVGHPAVYVRSGAWPRVVTAIRALEYSQG